MYEYLEGKLAGSTTQYAVVDVGGIGYKLALTAPDCAQLPPLGEGVRLYTSFVVRENEQTLYGFLTPAQRDLFETFTKISGIGPKTALGIVGSLSLELLHQALATEDPKLLAKVPGIGKKTAERLLIELKGKLPALPQGVSYSSKVEDAIGALINLGYSRMRAREALERPLEELGEEAELASLITAALKGI